MKTIFRFTCLTAFLLAGSAQAAITLTINTASNIATFVVDGTDTVSSQSLGPVHILDFGSFAGADGNYNNTGFSVVSTTAGTANWGNPVIPNGAFQISTSNNTPVFLHIEGRRIDPTPVGVTGWAGTLEATYSAAFSALTPGTYTLGVTRGTATSDLTINVVPEPASTTLLLGAGALAIAFIRRRFTTTG